MKTRLSFLLVNLDFTMPIKTYSTETFKIPDNIHQIWGLRFEAEGFFFRRKSSFFLFEE